MASVYSAKLFEESIAAAKKAVDDRDSSTRMRAAYNAGLAYFAIAADHQDATDRRSRPWFERSMKEDPSFGGNYYYLGVIQETMARVDALAAADTAIRQASLFSRPFVFLRHLDFPIAHATWTIFKPAVPTTVEGFCYAACGVLLALAFYHWGVKLTIRRALRRRAERRAGATGLATAAPHPELPGHDPSGHGPAA